MELVSTEHRERVRILRLNGGVTNPLNLQLVNELDENLGQIRDDSKVRALVLGSSNDKFFSIGFDIPELIELGEKDFGVFNESFNRLCLNLYTLPKPTIAAMTGHAIAGGCILALCCDYRFIAEGRKLMGVNEVKLGLPVPYPGDCILRQMVEARYARQMLELGEFYDPEQLARMGIVDKVLPLETVVREAVDKARDLGELPQQAFATIKRNRVEVVESQVQKHLADKEKSFMECWFSDEARERLRNAMKTF